MSARLPFSGFLDYRELKGLFRRRVSVSADDKMKENAEEKM